MLQKVCDCLLRKGTLTLANIIRFTELPPQRVKSCILVLIQHNCVQAFSMQQEGIGIIVSSILAAFVGSFREYCDKIGKTIGNHLVEGIHYSRPNESKISTTEVCKLIGLVEGIVMIFPDGKKILFICFDFL